MTDYVCSSSLDDLLYDTTTTTQLLEFPDVSTFVCYCIGECQCPDTSYHTCSYCLDLGVSCSYRYNMISSNLLFSNLSSNFLSSKLIFQNLNDSNVDNFSPFILSKKPKHSRKFANGPVPYRVSLKREARAGKSKPCNTGTDYNIAWKKAEADELAVKMLRKKVSSNSSLPQ